MFNIYSRSPHVGRQESLNPLRGLNGDARSDLKESIYYRSGHACETEATEDYIHESTLHSDFTILELLEGCTLGGRTHQNPAVLSYQHPAYQIPCRSGPCSSP